MRLADFILANSEAILREWDIFARRIWPEAEASPLILRDHAEAILRAAARDMATRQTAPQQAEKSKGGGSQSAISDRLDDASKDHAIGRVSSGFDLMELVAEYRALRASVVRLWSESAPHSDSHDLSDLTRFNESIDQSLAEAIRHFSEQMDRSREIFLGILGHDLRNPLNAMLLSAQALVETSEAEVASVASQIAASGEAMAGMLADFLDFTASRLGRGIPVSPASMDLAELCREVMAECEASFPGSTFCLELAGDLTGEWDERRIRQMLSNLVGNAVQHGSSSAPVLVSGTASEFNVRLQVQNSGEPIPEEAQAGIFDPLVQVVPPGNPKKTRTGSLGLGLYIAREVVTAHGGTIGVKSSRATGTLFTVILPRKKQSGKPQVS